MHPPAPAPNDPFAARPRLPWATVVATAVLTVAAILLGQRDWAVPERVLRDWHVAAVPSSMTALVLGVALSCLLAGGAVTLRDAALRPRDPAFLVWLAVCLLAAAALIWNALVMAADSEMETGAIIPVFHWMFTFVPALLTGLAARSLGGSRAVAAALGTGAVTLPLFGLGWSLLGSRETVAAGIGNGLWTTAVLGAVPLAIAAAISRSSALSAAWKRGHPVR
jgi:ABC-type Na+ efflux pump permease subunit